MIVYADSSALVKLAVAEPENRPGVLDGVYLLRLDRAVLGRAARLTPALLRSLDAIHVASALELGSRLDFVGYDERLIDAAAAAGLRTRSPLLTSRR